jgi:hypothetical protein
MNHAVGGFKDSRKFEKVKGIAQKGRDCKSIRGEKQKPGKIKCMRVCGR